MLKPYTKRVIVGFIFMAIYLVIRLYFPLLTAILIDDVVYAGKYGAQEERLLYIVLGAMVLLAVLRAGFVYFRQLQFEKISQGILYDVRLGLFKHLHAMPYRFYDQHQVGEIMSRMTGDIEAIRAFIAGGIISIIENLIYFFGSLIVIMTISPILALSLLAFTPFLAVIGYKFDNAIRPKFRAAQEQTAVLSTRAQENIAGAKVVKAYAREDFEKERFDKENKDHMIKGVEISSTFAKFFPYIEAIASGLAAVLLIVGGYLVSKSMITTGELLAVFGYLWMLSQPMRMIGQVLNMLSQTISSGGRVFYYMDFGSYIKEHSDATFPQEFKGHIEFDNVGFSYGDEEVLENISFEAKPGQTVAVMGSTGSGKTSLVNLLGRFYECHTGSVKIDGIDVKDYKIKQLRSNIAYVMQETFLFSDSLGSNIAFGRPDANIEDIKKAAMTGQAAEFIEGEKDGYEYIVGERGGGLSGGQKQRTSIARALLMDPKILVLDDSTAAVDMDTEHRIQEGLREASADRTTFIISHRISSVRDADLILVLNDGKLAESGIHETLIEKKGLYYNIFMDQFKDYMQIKGEEV